MKFYGVTIPTDGKWHILRVLTGMLVFVTVSTKPSDVYHKIENMELNLTQKLQENGEIFSSAEAFNAR